MKIIGANITGSFILNGQDVTNTIQSSNTWSGSVASSIVSLNNATASINSSISSLNAATASLNAATASLNNATASLFSSISSLNTFTASAATTGSNVFFGTQTITGSLFISQNLVVQGSSSIQNITASAVSIGTNTVILNTDSPAIRFGGIKVQDSGSGAGASGSLLWDSLEDRWLYVTPSGSSEGYNSAILISGPKNTGSVGSEVGLTTNKIVKAVGDDHIGDSIMTETGTTISVAGNLSATSLTGSINGSQLTDATVSNAKLANSSITVTAGTGLSGGGTVSLGSSITLTNTITNNNQLTNGAGYITGYTETDTLASVTSRGANTSTPVVFSGNMSAWNTTTPGTGLGTIQIGAANGTSNAGGAITFAARDGGGGSNAQAGIYINSDGSYGTRMYFATTDAYVVGSKVAMSISETGVVNFVRARPTYNGNTIIDTGNIGSQSVSSATSVTGTSTISGKLTIGNGASNALQINTDVLDGNTRDAIYLYENSGQASGRQAISWYNGGTAYYKARLWTEVGSGYNVTQFGIDVANNARTLATRLYINNGDTYCSGDVVAYASDFRLKENIKPIENALIKVQKISGVHYEWKDKVKELGFEPTTKQDVGVIAQSIQEVLPEAVKPAPFDYIGGTSKSGENYLTVQYEKIVPLLIEAIKEQQSQIEELKTIINALTK